MKDRPRRSIAAVIGLAGALPVAGLITMLHGQGGQWVPGLASAHAAEPRWFNFSLPLIMSITSDGSGANLLEMGVLKPGNRRTLLGELRTPVQTEIKHALPYDRINEDVGT